MREHSYSFGFYNKNVKYWFALKRNHRETWWKHIILRTWKGRWSPTQASIWNLSRALNNLAHFTLLKAPLTFPGLNVQFARKCTRNVIYQQRQLPPWNHTALVLLYQIEVLVKISSKPFFFVLTYKKKGRGNKKSKKGCLVTFYSVIWESSKNSMWLIAK